MLLVEPVLGLKVLHVRSAYNGRLADINVCESIFRLDSLRKYTMLLPARVLVCVRTYKRTQRYHGGLFELI